MVGWRGLEEWMGSGRRWMDGVRRGWKGRAVATIEGRGSGRFFNHHLSSGQLRMLLGYCRRRRTRIVRFLIEHLEGPLVVFGTRRLSHGGGVGVWSIRVISRIFSAGAREVFAFGTDQLRSHPCRVALAKSAFPADESHAKMNLTWLIGSTFVL